MKQSLAELRFLTEDEFGIIVGKADGYGYSDAEVIQLAAGTGLWHGEVAALWVGDVDLVTARSG